VPTWQIDDWKYLERRVVTDPRGRKWTVALMDVLGQEGDPEMPSRLLESQYEAGRYFTLIYSQAGAIQRERAYQELSEATDAYDALLEGVFKGTLDPSQPVFRPNLED
jgi:hypothetical protein